MGRKVTQYPNNVSVTPDELSLLDLSEKTGLAIYESRKWTLTQFKAWLNANITIPSVDGTQGQIPLFVQDDEIGSNTRFTFIDNQGTEVGFRFSDSTGNLTQAGVTYLNVETQGVASNSVLRLANWADNENKGIISFRKSRGSKTTPTQVYQNDALGHIIFSGQHNFGSGTTTCVIEVVAKENYDIIENPNTLNFERYALTEYNIYLAPSFSDSAIPSGFPNNLVFTVDGDGRVSFKNYQFPLFDGSAGNSLITNGAGQLAWGTPSASSATSLQTIGRNATGSTLYKGTIVYILGSTGNRPNFVKAQANLESTSAGTFGVVVNDIPNNSDGYVVTIGTLETLDTRSIAPFPFTTDTLVDGDKLYLSPTTAGYVTNVKPSAPNHIVYVGVVVRTSPTNGTIVYRIQNGYELEELHDVSISSLANNDVLQYESSTQLWKNKPIVNIYNSNGTLISNRTVTLNTFNLSFNGTDGTTIFTRSFNNFIQTLNLSNTSLSSTIENASIGSLINQTNSDVYFTIYDVPNTNDLFVLGITQNGLNINNFYTLPKFDGTNGQVLTTNGAGVVTWGNGGSSSSFIPDLLGHETYRGVNYSNNSTTEVTSGGITISTSASVIARSVSNTNYASKQIRKGFYGSVVSTGRYTGTRGSALLWYIGGGFKYVCDFYISDTTFGSGCRQFYGLGGQTTDLAYNDITLVSSLLNVIGVGSDSADANLQIFHNDSAGVCTKIDLGTQFPSNRTSGSIMTTMYSIQIYNAPNTSSVKVQVINKELGEIAQHTLTTNLPLDTQGLNFFASRTMGAPLTNSGQFDLGLLGVYSI
jgi:hypothetical protein